MKFAPTAVFGPLAEDQRWGGKIWVKGDLIVPEGVTLTLTAGTVVRFSTVPVHRNEERRSRRGSVSAVRDPNKCSVQVYGRLEVQGGGDPVRFGAESQWGGLHFLNRGSGAIQGAVFEDSVSECVAAWDDSEIEIEDVRFIRSWSGIGVYGNSRVRLANCRVEQAEASAVLCEGGELEWDGGHASAGKSILVQEGGTARFSGFEFRGADYGAVLHSGRLSVSGSFFQSQREAGLSMYGEGKAEVAKSEFRDSPVGAVTRGAILDLDGCRFLAIRGAGIETTGAGHVIKDVEAQSGEIGLVVGRGDCRVSGFKVRSENNGVSVREDGGLYWKGGEVRATGTGILVAGGTLDAEDIAVEGPAQGLRVEGGFVDGRRFAFSRNRDAALSLLEDGSVSIEKSRFEAAPAGAVSLGARLRLDECEFSGIEGIGVETRGSGHRLSAVSIHAGIGLVVNGGDCSIEELKTQCGDIGVSLRAGARVDWRGGSVSGGKTGVLVSGATLEISDTSCSAASQGFRVESGRLRADGLRVEDHRDTAFSFLNNGQAEIHSSYIGRSPVGIVTRGARLHVRGSEFIECASVCCSLEAGSHRVEGCFFDPSCRAVSIEADAEVLRDGELYRSSGKIPRAGIFQILWRSVLATRRWPGLRTLYRVVYAAAIAVFRRHAERDPSIVSSFVSRGWVTGDWEPAISDLDFLLVFRRERDLGRWIRDFWRRFGRWRRWFPFLGEVLAASEDDVEFYLRWGGIRAQELRPQTRLLSGRELPRVEPTAPRLSVAPLHECAHAYTRFMQHCYAAPDVPEDFSRRQVFKSAVDVWRYGIAFGDSGDWPVPTRAHFLGASRQRREQLDALIGGTPATAHAWVLRKLHTAAVFEDDAGGSSYDWAAGRAGGGPTGQAESLRMDVVESLSKCFGDTLHCVFLDDIYRSYIVLRDEAVEGDGLEDLLARWNEARVSRETGPLPVVVSERVWKAWRSLPYLENPAAFLDGARSWRAAGSWFPNSRQFYWGPPAAGSPPSDAFIERAALESAANLRLTWRLLASPSAGVSATYVLHYLLSRTLGLRLLLERKIGASFFDLDQLRDLYRKHFPKDAAAIDGLRREDWMRSAREAFFVRHEFFESQIGSLGDKLQHR